MNHEAASKFIGQKLFRLEIHHRVDRVIPIEKRIELISFVADESRRTCDFVT